MTAEAIKHTDGPQHNLKADTHSSPALHKEAIADLTSTKSHHQPDKGGEKKSVHIEGSAIKNEGKKNEPVEHEKHEKLNVELMAAVDHCTKVLVKVPADKNIKVDLLVKSDGKIVHTLDMDKNRQPNSPLTVGVEATPGRASISQAQTETVKEITDYANSKNKTLLVQTPTSTSAPVEKVAAPVPLLSHSSSTKAEAEPTSKHLVVRQSDHPTAQATVHHTRSEHANQRIDFTPASENVCVVSKPADHLQINIKQLLSEWFTIDPQKFVRLMPELYNSLEAPDGKLDALKLSQMQETNNPLLDNLKKNLQAFAKEFPQSLGSQNIIASTSWDAVNAVGSILADKASQVAQELSSSGYCAKGVSKAIEMVTGKTVKGNANDMRDSLPSHGFSQAPTTDLKVGQILHVSWTPEVYAQEIAKRGNCANIGDIAIIGKGKDGQLYAYNDHATPLQQYLEKTRYDWNSLKVFNPPA